jgi:PAS domain-containing protein
MAAHEIEVILNRQLADCMSIPVFITDTVGNLIFYNEPAEIILGIRFEDSGEMPVERWSTMFFPLDLQGNPMAPEELPLVMTLKECSPHNKTFRIKSLDNQSRKISATSYPILTRAGKFVGAVAIFWELKENENHT